MIQRIQSIFLILATISIIIIAFKFPILISNDNNVHTSACDISLIRWLLSISAGLSFFAVFQYKNITRQQFLSRLSRFIVTITLVLIVFLYKNESNTIGEGFFLLIVPFVLLIGANYFLAKDENLIKAADRLR
tara:strand:+ start:450 stop:848 length:399 start_codon:yes stop_codon:yes gene_type:complete